MPTSWSELPGWDRDRSAELWSALQRGCDRPPPGWAPLCERARVDGATAFNDAATRAWLQERLQPFRVESPEGAGEGLITGYFEPLVEASRVPRRSFRMPLYAPPPDLATRKPYWTRQQIDTLPAAQQALKGREIAYVADPLDALILQIQGSGRLQITEADGSRRLVRVAYAGHNDQPYRSVGRWLVEQGELKPEQASWPAIRHWARAHPQRVNELLWSNPRYVFFREEPLPDPQLGPKGAQAVPLTPGRSIAVDPLEHPVRHDRLARHHRAALERAAAPRRDGAGHRQRDHRRGARRLLLGLGRRGRGAGRPHEAAAASLGAVAERVAAGAVIDRSVLSPSARPGPRRTICRAPSRWSSDSQLDL